MKLNTIIKLLILVLPLFSLAQVVPVSFLRNTAPTYPAESVFCASGATIIVNVTNPATGKIWMDRNLGATQAATSSASANSYGDLYQWGRRSDGHQCRNSATTTTLSAVDQPANGNFIVAPNFPFNWRSPQNNNLWQGVNGINNPCPTGYRLPTETELNSERLSWSSNNATGAFASPLKLPIAGNRGVSSGSLNGGGSYGDYWSSSVSGTNARSLNFTSGNANVSTDGRAFGFSVRCLKDASVALTTPIVTPTIGTYTFSGAPQGPTTATNTGTGTSYTFSYVGVSPTVYATSASLPTAAGNYTVTVNVAANGNFTTASSTATAFTIALATPTVTPTIGTYTFSGAPQGPTTATNTGTGTSYTFSYAGVSPTVYAASASLPIAAGNYTVTVTVAANGNFTSASSVATAFTIAAATTPTYPAGSVFCASGATAVIDVTNPATGRIWMDRNLGATQVATSSTDINSYGDLYQWGRRSDGHQCRTSPTTATLSAVDQPANGNFITINSGNFDWRSPQNNNLWQGANGINNPCPTGYRLPTEAELNAERLSWSSSNVAGAFASPLKLPLAGRRANSGGSLAFGGSTGFYYSSTVSGPNAGNLNFNNSSASMNTFNRASGISVRCLKD